MSQYPINLGIRFVLEVTALTTFAIWGWNNGPGWWRVAAAIGLPVFFAAIWAVFAVKDDPSRSGKTVVPTKGFIRLFLELLFFGLASLALFDLGFNVPGLVFSILVLLHYAFSCDRIIWLLRQ
mgnify:CR=1 FL=1